MIPISGYSRIDKIYESDSSIVYRAWQERAGRPVILKVMKKEYPLVLPEYTN